MQYSKLLIELNENPKNVGSMDENDVHVGTGMIGAPACGDVMRLQIWVNDAGIIEDAKFKTYGCGAAIASTSLATEWLKGRTLAQALELKNDEIVKTLELPPLKIHCSVAAEEAIKAAVQDYRQKQSALKR